MDAMACRALAVTPGTFAKAALNSLMTADWCLQNFPVNPALQEQQPNVESTMYSSVPSAPGTSYLHTLQSVT